MAATRESTLAAGEEAVRIADPLHVASTRLGRAAGVGRARAGEHRVEIPESRQHIERGEHTKLYRFSPEDFREVVAVWNGQHPETGDELVVADEPHPAAAPAHDLPPQPAVFAPDYAPEEIAEIAQKLRKTAGLPDDPTGVVVSEQSADLVGALLGTARS